MIAHSSQEPKRKKMTIYICASQEIHFLLAKVQQSHVVGILKFCPKTRRHITVCSEKKIVFGLIVGEVARMPHIQLLSAILLAINFHLEKVLLMLNFPESHKTS